MLSKERLIKRFEEMVKISSPSLKEKNFCDYLKKELERLNLPYKEDNAGEKIGGNSGNLIINFEGKGDPIFLVAHMDTVSPCENIIPNINGEYIKSSGNTILGADNKSAIAAILEAVEAIIEDNLEHRNIEIIFTVAEEIGLLGAKNLDFSLIKSNEGYVLDSDGELGSVILRAPYHSRFFLNIYGKASHAGAEPEKGLSAILLSSEFILNLPWGKIDEDTTGNVGIIRGGRATNIIPDEVYLEGEFRSLDLEKLNLCFKNFEEQLKIIEIKGGKWNLKKEDLYKGYSFNEKDPIIERLKPIFENLNYKLTFRSTKGGSDANIFNERGLKALNIGIAVENPHSVDERIKIDHLFGLSKIVYYLIKN
ncbi:MAG: M20/M25/M40 family metallo-hydrolase [Dictyoglomus sp.]|nr:M20/M25/M40 family metallo-hydrolase [Dictyoglomus sp.]MCX7942686.1 M20/M25/M40 family metallo-hydrolase [Dictyoglomaceae bacterium]MDW8188151.1 M20/M25/M40 family metallo-hydrolase [Dictyoglomus sp.]